MGLSRAQTGLIHVAKNQLGLDDEEYRTLLKDKFNVTSSKELTWQQFKPLMKLFKQLGFKQLTGGLTQGQFKKIMAQVKDRNWDRNRLNGFVARQIGVRKAVETLSKAEAIKVIDGLKYMRA